MNLALDAINYPGRVDIALEASLAVDQRLPHTINYLRPLISRFA